MKATIKNIKCVGPTPIHHRGPIPDSRQYYYVSKSRIAPNVWLIVSKLHTSLSTEITYMRELL